MNVWEAILLGIVQGATEFLPISSDGHLVLVPALLGLPQPTLNVISIAHQGTLLAILIYFWKDIWAILGAILEDLRKWQLGSSDESRLGWYILLGSLPVMLLGLALKDFFGQQFEQPLLAAGLLLLNAGILITGEQLLKGDKPLSQMGKRDAFLIGVAQVFALLPGISRSGSTITTALWRGYDRPTAARFSFLLGIPAIAGAGFLSLVELVQVPDITSQLPMLLVSFASAGIVGYSCIHFLLSWVRRHSLYGFAVYCIVFSLFYLITALF